MSFLQKLDMVKLSDNQTYVLAEMINENNIDYLEGCLLVGLRLYKK